MNELPRRVDDGLQQNLMDWLDQIERRLARDCRAKEPRRPSPTETPTETATPEPTETATPEPTETPAPTRDAGAGRRDPRRPVRRRRAGARGGQP